MEKSASHQHPHISCGIINVCSSGPLSDVDSDVSFPTGPNVLCLPISTASQASAPITCSSGLFCADGTVVSSSTGPKVFSPIISTASRAHVDKSSESLMTGGKPLGKHEDKHKSSGLLPFSVPSGFFTAAEPEPCATLSHGEVSSSKVKDRETEKVLGTMKSWTTTLNK